MLLYRDVEMINHIPFDRHVLYCKARKEGKIFHNGQVGFIHSHQCQLGIIIETLKCQSVSYSV